jgi:tetratricopeptide (TPR) repeat protein
MIVRDEEAFLRDCLASARGVADEIVIVDTGSHDATIPIAREFGAHVVEYAWDDDFAAARNRALEAASGEWMLALDADERLDPRTAPRIRETVAGGQCEAGYLHFVDMTASGPSGQEWMAPRLYRLRPGLRYVGRVHEQVVQSPGRIRVCAVGTIVYHYGYQESIYRSRQKKERITRLLEKALEDPGAQDPLLRANYLFHYANQASGIELLRRYEAFAAYVKETWPRDPPRAPWITGGLAEYARLLTDAQCFEQARSEIEDLLHRTGESPMLRYLRARALAAQGELAAAEDELRAALRATPVISADHRKYPQDVALVRAHAHFLLGLLREKQGKLEEAASCYKAAVEGEPEEHIFRGSLACVLARLARYDQALRALEASPALLAEPQRGMDCLGFVLALLAHAPGRLLWWGAKLRKLAEQFPPAAALLERVELLGPDHSFRLEDFPEIAASIVLTVEPGKFRFPAAVRRSAVALPQP